MEREFGPHLRRETVSETPDFPERKEPTDYWWAILGDSTRFNATYGTKHNT